MVKCYGNDPIFTFLFGVPLVQISYSELQVYKTGELVHFSLQYYSEFWFSLGELDAEEAVDRDCLVCLSSSRNIPLMGSVSNPAMFDSPHKVSFLIYIQLWQM